MLPRQLADGISIPGVIEPSAGHGQCQPYPAVGGHRATWEGAEFFSFIHPQPHAELPLSPEMPQVLQGAGQGVPGQGDRLGNG